MRMCPFLLMIFTFLAAKCVKTDTHQERLVKAIFANYNKQVRPAASTADVINVTIDPALYRIIRTDEVAESLTIVQNFRMTWKDALLTWDPSEFGGTKQLLLPISEFWYPDVVVDNTISIKEPVSEDRNFAFLDNKGKVSAEISQILTMHCIFDIVMFPFDIQNCTMNIGSWSYNEEQMDLFCITPADTLFYINSSEDFCLEWDLISVMARKSKRYYWDSITAYIEVHYDIVIQRKPIYYLLTFVLPCFIITTISIIGIFSPFNDAGMRREKVTMGLTTLLTMIFVLTLIADRMPKSSTGLPLLGIYIMLQVAINAMTSMFAVIIMYQNRKWTTGDPIPGWIYYITRTSCKRSSFSVERKSSATHYTTDSKITDKENKGGSPLPHNTQDQQTVALTSILLMTQRIERSLQDQNEEDSHRQEWQRVTDRLDLLLMIIFLILNCIVTVCFLIVGYANLQI